MKTYETLKLEHVSDHVMVVTLDRPEARNAINADLHAEFGRIFTDAERDDIAPSLHEVEKLADA